MRTWTYWLTVGALSASVAACNRAPATADKEQPKKADPVAVAVGQRLAQPAPESIDERRWPEVAKFYAQHEQHLAWVTPSDVHRSEQALAIFRLAPQHGINPTPYGADALTKDIAAFAQSDPNAGDRLDRAVDLDARVTAALLMFGHDLAVGGMVPTRISSTWKTQRTPPDVSAALAKFADTDLSGWIAAIQPQHSEYVALVGAMKTLLDQKAKGATRFANAPIDDRIRLVAINLERWRWAPDNLGDRHLLVNIPALHVYMREQGKVVSDMRVVVGKPDGHQTPVFSSTMATVVFSPSWNVPYGIGQNETAPAAANDPAYLTNRNIEVRRGTKLINEGEINWFNPADLKGLTFKQKPGTQNALGQVKFLFPNPYDVYLHDTPDDSFFGESMRALSHGCVRVAEPKELANYVLRGDPDWTPERISKAMTAGVERGVKLRAPLPIHIVYFTAWVNDRGNLDFEPDIYGYDARQIRLAEAPRPTPKKIKKAGSSAN